MVLSTTELSHYKSTFTADGIKTHTGTWSTSSGKKYTSLLVQVPSTQMVIEFVQETTLAMSEAELTSTKMEQRVSDQALASIDTEAGSVLQALAVNRAASEYAMSQLEGFYTGMGASVSHSVTEDSMTKKCFLWPGATTEAFFVFIGP